MSKSCSETNACAMAVATHLQCRSYTAGKGIIAISMKCPKFQCLKPHICSSCTTGIISDSQATVLSAEPSLVFCVRQIVKFDFICIMLAKTCELGINSSLCSHIAANFTAFTLAHINAQRSDAILMRTSTVLFILIPLLPHQIYNN